ncbi:MAG: arabinan endo-1,5-alpha-L-arabinosidase [Chloroflexota bacterium]
MKPVLRHIFSSILMLTLFNACQPTKTESAPTTAPAVTDTPAPVVKGTLLEPQGFIQRIHDPVIAHAGDTYYVYSTGSRIPFICSKDKINWEFCGRIFESNPAWVHDINPNLVDIWAPDISFFNNQWHLYYAASNFGEQNSAIGLVTNVTLDPKSPDYKWVDQGIVLRSKPGDQWNAIDPNLVLDENGETWLAWGSFWQGLWMRKIDKATGQFDANDTIYHHLADRSTGPDHTPAIEGAFIVQRAGKWYLFASFDQCCQGIASTYNVHVGRSDSLTGPYVDRAGVSMTEGGGTLILSAYGQWKGPGHNGMLIEDGIYWMVYHAYDAKQIGISKLRIESITWDADGWPSLPSQTQ